MLVTELQDKHDAFAASAAALTKSGTSTLELAMAGVPMVVTYRVNPLTAAIARRLVTVRYASLVNLLAGREVVPELIQEACTPERLADGAAQLLDDPAVAAAQRAAFRDVAGIAAPARGHAVRRRRRRRAGSARSALTPPSARATAAMLSVTASAAASARRPAAASTSTGAPSSTEAANAACSAASESWSCQDDLLDAEAGDARHRLRRARAAITVSLRLAKSAAR